MFDGGSLVQHPRPGEEFSVGPTSKRLEPIDGHRGRPVRDRLLEREELLLPRALGARGDGGDRPAGPAQPPRLAAAGDGGLRRSRWRRTGRTPTSCASSCSASRPSWPVSAAVCSAGVTQSASGNAGRHVRLHGLAGLRRGPRLLRPAPDPVPDPGGLRLPGDQDLPAVRRPDDDQVPRCHVRRAGDLRRDRSGHQPRAPCWATAARNAPATPTVPAAAAWSRTGSIATPVAAGHASRTVEEPVLLGRKGSGA